MVQRFIANAVCLGLLACAVRAADWPCYMGPDRNGTSPETGLARSWPAGGPRVLWAVPVAPSFGAPTVRDGRVYVLDRDDEKWLDHLVCLNVDTGKELWRHSYYAYGALAYDGRGQPSVDEKNVYSMGPFGDLHCVDRLTGKYVWSCNVFVKPRDLNNLTNVPAKEVKGVDVYGIGSQPHPKWGMQRNPVLHRDTVIVAPLSPQGSLLALDKETGALRWKSPASGRGFYAHQTPLLARLAGRAQLVLCSNVNMGPKAWVSGFDAGDGRLLWSLPIEKYNIPMPSPVAVDGSRVFLAGGYTAGARMLSITNTPANSNAMDVAVLFANTNCTPMIQTPVLYAGHLYASSYDEFHNPRIGVPNRGLACYNLDGSVRWQTGPERHFDQGGFLVADGMIYIVHGREGTVHLVEANPDRFAELASAKVFAEAPGGMQARHWSPIALSDGKLLLRSGTELKCLDVRSR